MTIDAPIRVRLAPSPTGYFHVGTARTALHNWLYARQRGGTFALRIEDTDTARNQPGQIAGIQRALRWLRLDWDGEVVLQSERGDRHREAIDALLASGHAYACDCTPAQVDARRPPKAPVGYDGFCRDRGLAPSIGRVVRFRVPDAGVTSFDDLVLGRNETPNASVVDFSIRKSDGSPLFLLSNPVDDADMGITHVIRGADHTSNTTRYVLVWEALGFGSRPVFAHTPLINNAAGKKLSKRRDKVAVEDYQAEGYLPEGMVNYLSLLGWAPKGERDLVTIDDLLAEFRIEDVKSAPAIFDERKLASVNAAHLRALPAAALEERATAWLLGRVAPLLPLVQERSRTLAEVWAMTDFLYLAEPSLDRAAWNRSVAKHPAFGPVLDGAAERLATVAWDADAIRAAVADAGAAAGITSLGKAQEPVRLAVTGRTVGPPLFESIELLGRDRTLARLAAASARLASESAPPA